jgi:hypothetical protein
MTFTDDDLKRVKGEIPKGMAGYGFDDMDTFTMEDLQALIARLEAAEAVIRVTDEHGFNDRAFDVYETWRKAAGKNDRSPLGS